MKWAVLWRSNNRLDGKRQHFMWQGGRPLLFATRKEAKSWIDVNYGYLAARQDLRKEPHGWKMPLPIRVTVTIKPCRIRGGSIQKET